jgi:hypothetical protein
LYIFSFMLVAGITGSMAAAYEDAGEYVKALELYRKVLGLEQGRPADQCRTLSHIVGTAIIFRFTVPVICRIQPV